MTTYVIALEDGENEGTLHTFTDQALWVWLNAPVEFPEGATRIQVPIPGTSDFAPATIGSPNNDLAHYLVTHPDVVEVNFDDLYADELALLTEQVGADNIFEGLWY